MAEIIWDFNDFMSRKFKSLSMGLTPSGNLHMGFLSTLACALMYLREHPHTHLIITNVENSLSCRLEKYNWHPLRFQCLVEGDLVLPKDFNKLKKRNLVGRRVHGQLNNLVWQLAQIFDENSAKELRDIKQSWIPPRHKRFLELKENKVYHIFGTQIYIYSFLSILSHDNSFRNNMVRFLTDPNFAKIVAPMACISFYYKKFGKPIHKGSRMYQPECFPVPIRLYCPKCYRLCSPWAIVIISHPEFRGPTFAARCTNFGRCQRANVSKGYEGYIYYNMKECLEMGELHFLLNSMRDFFDPFKAECHIFGGDYFHLLFQDSSQRAIDKIVPMFNYLEKKTDQNKQFFGGPLITMGGLKMSKSGESLNIDHIGKIKPVFLKIVRFLEEIRSKSFPTGISIEYRDLLKKTA